MLKWLRRQRLLAALMITANPALIGSWAAAYHPCPVRDGAQWRSGAGAQGVVASVMDHAGHEGMAEAPAAPSHGHGDEAATCSCIGQCLTGSIGLPLFAGDETKLALDLTQHSAPSTQHSAVVPTTRPLDLLPPSTAPPIA